ncbi:hypothetical protein GCM10022399_28720 [Terrabacter ginsenosidimutans]|uniref:Uncharacterized protein n=1 Tax=Terrabacter ginsenosidimutans TaxID=490575 RepID=A0ABP7DVF0_9MICO
MVPSEPRRYQALRNGGGTPDMRMPRSWGGAGHPGPGQNSGGSPAIRASRWPSTSSQRPEWIEGYEPCHGYLRSLKKDDSYTFTYQFEYIAENHGNDNYDIARATMVVRVEWSDLQAGYVISYDVRDMHKIDPSQGNGDAESFYENDVLLAFGRRPRRPRHRLRAHRSVVHSGRPLVRQVEHGTLLMGHWSSPVPAEMQVTDCTAPDRTSTRHKARDRP